MAHFPGRGRASAARVPEEKLVDALALVTWPTGVNRLVNACTVWHGLMRSGLVQSSPLFRAWAETPDQGALGA